MSVSNAFDKVTFRGRTVDKKTRAFLLAMEARLGYELTVVQGSYNSTVKQSGGTHDKGGVVDLAAWDWERKVKVAADLGAFVWHRPYLPGVWGEHIHLGIRDHGNLSTEAARQQVDWDSRPPRNGLASHALMNLKVDYHPMKKITFQYPTEPIVLVTPTRVTKARDALVEAIHNLGESAALLDAVEPSRVRARVQLDELHAEIARLQAILDALPKR